MKSAVETLNPTRAKLTIEVPFEELKPSLDAAYQRIAKQVNVPGFRKGKVPPAVIDRQVGRGVVLDEAINEALPKMYVQALQDNDLQPLAQPEIDITKFEDNQALEFTAEVDVRPSIDVPSYDDLISSPRRPHPLKNSMIIGVASTLLSMVLGTLAALGLAQWKSRFKPLVLAFVLSPVVVPGVITAVGLYFFFAPIGLTGSYLGLILAHTALATPFVVITVGATLQSFDTNLARAAASLGASPLEAFRRVILPLILPGLASGALFAFATSFDEVVIVLFMAGPEQRTLPREMFSGIRENISPTITAAAVILTTVSIILLATMEGLRRRNERLKGGG